MKRILIFSALILAGCAAVPKPEQRTLTPEQEQRQRQQRKEIGNDLLILGLRIIIRII